jgi:hypothetical protein
MKVIALEPESDIKRLSRGGDSSRFRKKTNANVEQ